MVLGPTESAEIQAALEAQLFAEISEQVAHLLAASIPENRKRTPLKPSREAASA
jgi:Na+-transporting methylmalonyl-CoA/oxaloacetate decarboxylase gamma subunit